MYFSGQGCLGRQGGPCGPGDPCDLGDPGDSGDPGGLGDSGDPGGPGGPGGTHICIQKIYGLQGLNHQIIEES